MHFKTLLAISLALAACGSVRVFELPKVQRTFMDTLQKSEIIVQRAQTDYADKKMLVDNLSKNPSPTFKQNELKLRNHLRAMDQALQEVVVEKRNMSEANGDLASLSYNRAKVHSHESEFPKVEETVQRFEASADRLNASMVDYSRESNSMADLIARQKLFYNFDVAEFQKRVQKNIQISQESLKVMQRELTRAENVINNSRGEGRKVQEEMLGEMRDTANAYSQKANRFAEISGEVHDVTEGNARISTLDPQWPGVQKLVFEFERVVSDLLAMNEKFQRDVETFRNPARRVR